METSGTTTPGHTRSDFREGEPNGNEPEQSILGPWVYISDSPLM